MSLIGNIYSKAINKDLNNIFCYGLDWRFQKMLEQCMPDYNFYGDSKSFIFSNYDNNDYISNFYNSSRIPKFRSMSLIIINDISQYEHCRRYSFNHHIPILFFNHTENVYDIDGVEIVNNPPYYIEIQEPCEKEFTNVISGDFVKESLDIINTISNLIDTHVLGNLNKVKYEEYCKTINSSIMYSYLSDNIYNRIDLLDAMAAGCTVIANNSELCKKHVTHMETGLISDSLESFEKCMNSILRDKELVKMLSSNAVQYIKNNYNDKNKLRTIIETASKKYYMRIGK